MQPASLSAPLQSLARQVFEAALEVATEDGHGDAGDINVSWDCSIGCLSSNFAVPCLPSTAARKSFFSTLPTGLRGSDSMKSTVLGALTLPSFALHSAMISSALTVWPLFSSTTALTASPHLRVGHADDGAVLHRGVAPDHLLDLARIDVEAARDDHVLLAVGDVQEAFLVDVADVAGVQPAVDDGLRGLDRGPCSNPS